MPTATRDTILDAATRLIHARGFHNTSIDDILREGRVGKGHFHRAAA
jgi:AcrR family transcriptional regulator